MAGTDRTGDPRAALWTLSLLGGLAVTCPVQAQEALPAVPVVPDVAAAGPAVVDMSAAVWLVPPEPAYPRFARYLGEQAVIGATLIVDSTGRPLRTRIDSREPVHAEFFDEATRTALMQGRVRMPASAVPGQLYAYRAAFRFVMQDTDPDGPAVVARTPPQLPAEAVAQGVEGWVSVLLRVDSLGRPEMDQAKVLGRSPAQFGAFDARALEALAGYRFRPRRLQGDLPGRWTIVRVDFSQTGR